MVDPWSPKMKTLHKFSYIMATWPNAPNVMTRGFVFRHDYFHTISHTAFCHLSPHPSSLWHPHFSYSIPKPSNNKKNPIKQNEDQSQFCGLTRVPRLRVRAWLSASREGEMTRTRSWPGRYHRHDCFKRSIFISAGVTLNPSCRVGWQLVPSS